MPDAVEVAIEAALLAHASAFANNNSLTISLPNIAFTVPTVSATAKYLRATFLPAPTASIALSFTTDKATNQHVGIMQVDVFYGQGGGEIAPARIAANIIDWFKPGTSLSSDGFTVNVIRSPYRGPIIKSDPWMMLPVTIPYIAFATNPA